MLTRNSLCLLGFGVIIIAFALGPVRGYTLLDALDNEDSCPAYEQRREILSPQHKTHYNIVENGEQQRRVPHKPLWQFKPAQWLLRIIKIRGVLRDRPKVQSREELLKEEKRNGKMLLILENRPHPGQQANHFFM